MSEYCYRKGRYIFVNGDFYDGEFHKDKAHGLGTYYHNNGSIFTGQWVHTYTYMAITVCMYVCMCHWSIFHFSESFIGE